jgi:DNA-binding beta-propeller fold protein YncE
LEDLINMRIGTGSFTYEWVDNWARIPETPSGLENGRTHGVVVTDSGNVMVFNQADPGVLTFDPSGKLINSWGDRFSGAHGMTLVKEDGTEYLWLTDQNSREVVKTTLDGRTVMNIEQAPHPVYGKANYAPTWVAVNEERHGGNGDIWVTDGYGSNYVHRYDKAGRYIGSINGEEGATGAFKCPHGIWIDTRKSEPELYVADRSNKRVQVYDSEGAYKRAFGADFLTSPDGFITHGDLLIIPELFARITILDANDQLVCHLGANEEVVNAKGWPNFTGPELQQGKFNSPHGIASDRAGNLYVVEWIVGGRITKLVKC